VEYIKVVRDQKIPICLIYKSKPFLEAIKAIWTLPKIGIKIKQVNIFFITKYRSCTFCYVSGPSVTRPETNLFFFPSSFFFEKKKEDYFCSPLFFLVLLEKREGSKNWCKERKKESFFFLTLFFLFFYPGHYFSLSPLASFRPKICSFF